MINLFLAVLPFVCLTFIILLMSAKLSSLITDFIEYCEIEKGLSPTTAEKYDYRLSKFVGWLAASAANSSTSEVKLDDLTHDAVRKFRVHLNRRELAQSTQYHYAVVIRAFTKISG